MERHLALVKIEPANEKDPMAVLEARMLARPASLWFESERDVRQSRRWLKRHGIKLRTTRTVAMLECRFCGETWLTAFNGQVGQCPRGPHLAHVK